MVDHTLSHWGLYEVETRDGELPVLRPFARDPSPSPIGLHQAAPELARLRVLRPSVRRSWLDDGPGAAPEKRGMEPFVEVEWDRAVELVAGEIERVRSTWGNGAIFGGSYGWSSAGRFHHAQSQVHRFLGAAGGYVRHVGSYSLGAAIAILPHVVARMEELMVSHSSWDTLVANTRLFVTFGGVPVKNGQVNPGGVALHGVPSALAAMAGAGVRFVNIGPVGDNMGTLSGTAEWIPCRPNTDAAVMLAMAYVLVSEKLHDEPFLARCTVGFERFKPYLKGEVDGVAKTPEWAEAISGVPARAIAQLARDMAATRTMINAAWSLQRALHGEQPYWMAVVLAAMLGHIGRPGGGFGLGYGAANLAGNPHVRAKGPTLSQGRNPVPDFIPVARIADMLLSPGGRYTYDGQARIYPDIRLIYWAGGNPYHHHQDLNRLNRAWQKPETIVVHEAFWTATARRADIVLPATTTLERDDIGSAAREAFMVAMKRAMPAPGAARDDYAIFSALAEKLGFGVEFTEGLDTMGWLRRLYSEARTANHERGIALPAFDDFWRDGLIDLSCHDAPVTMFADFVADPDANPLGTPSGRIEIFSADVAAMRLPDCPGHPAWLERGERLGGSAARASQLHLLSDQPERRLHSQMDASPHSVDGKLDGRERVHMNPLDMKARGIADGQVVVLSNERGRCMAAAKANDLVMPGVARLNTGAWYDPAPATGLDRQGNPNVLTSDAPASSLSQASIAQTCLVEVTAWQGPLPAVGAFDLPEML